MNAAKTLVILKAGAPPRNPMRILSTSACWRIWHGVACAAAYARCRAHECIRHHGSAVLYRPLPAKARIVIAAGLVMARRHAKSIEVIGPRPRSVVEGEIVALAGEWKIESS